MTDLDQIRCFKCGNYGHMKRSCPSKPKTSRRDSASGAVSEEHKAACYSAPMPEQRPLSEIADYAKCAAVARQILADALGQAVDLNPHYVITPFRQAMKLPPRTEADLREIARQQVEEARTFAERAAGSA